MKTACNIPVLNEEATTCTLTIEAGDQGLSLLWFNDEQQAVKGLVVFNFEAQEKSSDQLSALINSYSELITKAPKLKLFINHSNCLIVPALYNKPEWHASFLELMYGEKEGMKIGADEMNSENCAVIYYLPSDIQAYLKAKTDSGAEKHSNTTILNTYQEEDLLYCQVFYESVKILLRKQGQLCILQEYRYSSPEDVAYHLLQTCASHDVKPESARLRLCGMIARDSHLYDQLYNYFLDIAFIDCPAEIELQKELAALPPHFLTHLIVLAQCES